MIDGIFVTLSGGGFRATGFHAGTFWVLDRLGLLGRVTGISSASGGTIFAARYLRSLKKDPQPFETFFEKTVKYMLKTNVIRLAAQKMMSKRDSADTRARTLIVGAADVYAEPDCVGDMTFGDLFALDSPIKEISLNATEFNGGLAFRFLRSNGRARFGNGNLRVPHPVAKRIRVADIVAASAAFPGGFEPIAFPDDFAWGPEGRPAAAVLTKGQNKVFELPLPLMDGGIDDNQGIGSLLLALDRDKVKRPELVLVSDVQQWDGSLYEQKAAAVPTGLNIGQLVGLTFSALIFSFVAAATSGTIFVKQVWEGDWRSTFAAVPFLLCLAIFFGVGAGLQKIIEVIKPYWKEGPYPVKGYWKQLRKMPVSEAVSLLMLRGRSMLALTSRVFMKRVRDGVRSDIASALGKSVAWASIYLLWKDKGQAYANGEPRPSADAADCVKNANEMKTVLWAESADEIAQLRSAVAAGRLTTCAAILRWIDADPDKAAGRQELRASVRDLLQKLDRAPLDGIPDSP